ncbi:hypothetical protein [Agromyces sp. NPDC058104]|uniref:hypothetical protein n=1 Tax=Agromyces sp. NPDC058104 TaxID=3346342 RepID=UPI0036DE9C91
MGRTLAPIARPHDPESSWDAAEQQTPSRREIIKAVIVTLIKNHGPMSDEEINDRFEAYRFMYPSVPAATPQNIRTRRKELEVEGLVRASDRRGLTRTGSTCQLWVIS